MSIPGYLRRWPCSLPGNRRRRKRGRRGGFAVKLKHFLAQRRESRLSLDIPVKGLAGDFSIRWRSLDPVYEWNTSVIPAAAAPFPVYGSPRIHRAGLCLSNLRQLSRVRQESTENPPQLKMALLNAKSVGK